MKANTLDFMAFNKFRVMTSLRLILSTSLTLAFILLASHLIFRPPLSSIVREKYTVADNSNGVPRPLKNVSDLVLLEHAGKSLHYLIFDAIEHKGSLEFLDNLSAKWEILVVNLANKSQLESCRRCQVVKKTWTRKFLATETASPTWKQVPNYAEEKIVAILYALWNSAEWLYVTDSQFLPTEEELLSVCSHKVITI